MEAKNFIKFQSDFRLTERKVTETGKSIDQVQPDWDFMELTCLSNSPPHALSSWSLISNPSLSYLYKAGVERETVMEGDVDYRL